MLELVFKENKKAAIYTYKSATETLVILKATTDTIIKGEDFFL